KDPSPNPPRDPKDVGTGSGSQTVKTPPTTTAADCDPDQYRSKGTEFVNMGQYGAGLQQFKKAMSCKGGNTLAVVRLAYMAACGAGDAPTAKALFAQIPPAQQGNLVQICMRNHIDPTSGKP